MHWLECSLLVTTLFAAHGIDSAAQPEEGNKPEKIPTTVDPKENQVYLETTDSGPQDPVSTDTPFQDLVLNNTENLLLAPANLTDSSSATNLNALDNNDQMKENKKRDVDNVTLNDVTPFLLFPILPFLFPPRESKSSLSDKKDFPIINNDSTPEGNTGDGKPFIFFDFAFNIRRLPLNNGTDLPSSKLIEKLFSDKNVNLSKPDDPETPQKNRLRRNTNAKLNTLGFFDDSPLFPDSELDEFLPKPDLFFPDLPFHHKPVKKLSRRKRGQKKHEFSDVKMFMDAFDDAFMNGKKETEPIDPFMNFLREAEQSFDEERKEPEDLFGQVSDSQENPTMKWRIQRNIKRLKNDRHNEMTKSQESPMIIVDKVVKIGEFHMHEDGHDDKSKKKKKRDAKVSKNLLTLEGKDELIPKNIMKQIKQEESRKKKRSHHLPLSFPNVQSKEIKVLPPLNTSVFLINASATTEHKDQETEAEPQGTAISRKSPMYGSLLKMVDTLKGKMKIELQNAGAADPSAERLLQRNSTYARKKKRSNDDLRKNVTELIKQFLAVVKQFDDVQLMNKFEANEGEDAGGSGWTEKDTLQNLDTYFLREDPRGRLRKKNADIEKEFVELDKKERQVSDLNYLFLTVTLPTVFVIALLLLVCFFNLQIRGKICTKLFRPRQVFLVEDESASSFVYKNPAESKIRNF